MRVSAQAFYAPKAGNKESEYEDSFCPERLIGKGDSTFRFAVGDGATETSFSGVWARELVRAFCKGELEGAECSRSLRALRERWLKVVSRKPMPWYAEEKVRSGAFAAIVGLVLDDSPKPEQDGRWTAFAIGDSCVVQLRESELVSSFPIQSSDQFNNSPLLLCSRVQDEADKQGFLTMSGSWQKGDTFYLMTDAIACWFLAQAENGRAPSQELKELSFSKSRHFQSWLKSLRERKDVRNDDVTILRVEIENY
jgi:hypothetical protein